VKPHHTTPTSMMTSPWGTRPDELEATADMVAMATAWMRCRRELRCEQCNVLVQVLVQDNCLYGPLPRQMGCGAVSAASGY
jgi:hypothetical protein